MFRMPIQQFALMSSPRLRSELSVHRVWLLALLARLGGCEAGRNARVGLHDLADLHDLLEAAKVVDDLLSRLLAEQLQQRGADLSARRRVLHLDGNDRAFAARPGAERDLAGVVQIRVVDRLPG